MKHIMFFMCAIALCSVSLVAHPVPALPQKSFVGNYLNRWTSPRKLWGVMGAGLGAAGLLTSANKARKHHAKVLIAKRRLTDPLIEDDEREETIRALQHHKRWRSIYTALAGGAGIVGGIGAWWFAKHLGIDRRDADLPKAVGDMRTTLINDYARTRSQELAEIDKELAVLAAGKEDGKRHTEKLVRWRIANIRAYGRNMQGADSATTQKVIKEDTERLRSVDHRDEVKKNLMERKKWLLENEAIPPLDDVALSARRTYHAEIPARKSDIDATWEEYHVHGGPDRRQRVSYYRLNQSIARQKNHEKQGAGWGWLNPLHAPDGPTLKLPIGMSYEDYLRSKGYGRKNTQ